MTSPNGFQNVVNNQPGVAAAGDFADANIRVNVLAGPGALVSAAGREPIVGNFAWANQLTGLAARNYLGTVAEKIGFVHSELQTAISEFLAGASLIVNKGFPVTLMDQGSFWAEFLAGATVGQKVFANYVDGSVYAAAAGASTQVSAFTGVIAVTTGILTASSVTGPIAAGQVISGVGVPAGTVITSQISGTPGGAGTYQTSIITAVGSVSMTTAASVETSFSVDSPAAAGELAKISTWG